MQAGGGSKSDFWLQLKADVTGKPIRSLKINEAGCLAASIIAGYGIGKYNSISEAANRIIKIKKNITLLLRIMSITGKGLNFIKKCIL